MKIELVGGIGVGKTTLTKCLEKKGCVGVFEDITANPYVGKVISGEDISMALPSQLTFAIKKFEFKAEPGKTYVFDQGLITNLAFNHQLFPPANAGLLDKIFFLTQEFVGYPDMIIHVKCDPKVQLGRILERNREYETRLDMGALMEVNSELEKALKVPQICHIPSMEVDTSSMTMDDYESVADKIVSRARMYGSRVA